MPWKGVEFLLWNEPAIDVGSSVGLHVVDALAVGDANQAHVEGFICVGTISDRRGTGGIQ